MPSYVIILLISMILLYIIVRVGSQGDIDNEDSSRIGSIKTDQTKEFFGDPFIKRIQTYFFTDNTFDFEKFSDYIICIKDNMTMSEYAECLLELDMMIKVSSQLKDRIFAIIMYDEKLKEFSYKNFESIRNDLREGKYRGTYQELTNILITTILYLKHKTQTLRLNK